MEKWWGTESKTKWVELNPRGALQTIWHLGKEIPEGAFCDLFDLLDEASSTDGECRGKQEAA